MVPPMFYGEVPQAIKLSEYKVEKHQDRVKGDIAERKVFYALQEYYRITGDDTLVVHSHKFRVHDDSNNEKDFIVLNLTKGKYLAEFLMCLVNTYFSSMLHLLGFRLRVVGQLREYISKCILFLRLHYDLGGQVESKAISESKETAF